MQSRPTSNSEQYKKQMNIYKSIITALEASRARQWSKNFLVFAAAIFTKDQSIFLWTNCIKAFASFCFISSFIYIINDIIDLEADRQHPRKRFRPIASGRIKIFDAVALAIVWLILSLTISASVDFSLLATILIYLAIQIAYCFGLKRQPLLDLFCIASGFLLRAIAGVVASQGHWSPWFLLTVGLLALFLAVEKRKAELRTAIDRGVITRKVLLRYSLPLLQRLESLVASTSFMAYALWSAGPALQGAETSWMLLSVPFVLVGIFRYQLLSDPDEAERRLQASPDQTTEKPEEILLNDRGIQVTLIAWLITVITVNLLNRFGLLP